MGRVLTKGSYEQVKIEATTLGIYSSDAAKLRSIQQQFRNFHQPNVVVYMPVETSDGIATIRLESSTGTTPFSTKIAKATSLSRFRLIELAAQGAQPLGNTARSTLRAELLPADRTADAGKTVFIIDNAYYGLLPEVLELEHGATFSSATLETAVKNLNQLKDLRIKPGDFTAFVGYPETEADLKAVFKGEKTATLETWKQRSEEARKLSGEFGFKLYGSSELNKLPNKEAVLKSIEASQGIIWITAHSQGCRIRLSAGEAVEISASDIASLHLTKHPFVIVRACNGNEAGFAKAFIVAGASAVWVNEGKILASEVNSEIGQFFKAAQDGTVSEAIKAVKDQSGKAFRGTGLHVELLPDRRGNELGN